MSLAEDVVAFGAACDGVAARLAVVEGWLGIPAAPPAALPPLRIDPSGGTRAAAADVAAAQTMLGVLGDARDLLAVRVTTLFEALLAFVRAQRDEGVAARAPLALPSDERLSRAALDGLQKQLVAAEALLARLELRVGNAEDALDAFFGSAS